MKLCSLILQVRKLFLIIILHLVTWIAIGFHFPACPFLLLRVTTTVSKLKRIKEKLSFSKYTEKWVT